jgi:hypothetical protein
MWSYLGIDTESRHVDIGNNFSEWGEKRGKLKSEGGGGQKEKGLKKDMAKGMTSPCNVIFPLLGKIIPKNTLIIPLLKYQM